VRDYLNATSYANYYNQPITTHYFVVQCIFQALDLVHIYQFYCPLRHYKKKNSFHSKYIRVIRKVTLSWGLLASIIPSFSGIP
jgi:hypothetical protein